jgi:hypothetical protein
MAPLAMVKFVGRTFIDWWPVFVGLILGKVVAATVDAPPWYDLLFVYVIMDILVHIYRFFWEHRTPRRSPFAEARDALRGDVDFMLAGPSLAYMAADMCGECAERAAKYQDHAELLRAVQGDPRYADWNARFLAKMAYYALHAEPPEHRPAYEAAVRGYAAWRGAALCF